MSLTLSAAGVYVRRGWKPVPVHPGQKRPIGDGWEKLRLTENELPAWFSNGNNIGLLTGEPSDKLIDVDLDCDEARLLFSDFLPPTDLISGRKSYPKSHIWFCGDPLPATKKFQDPLAKAQDAKAMLVELRSTGLQTLVYPSIHPSGDEYFWTDEGDPAIVPGAVLQMAVAKLAACCLLARYWAEGKRHELALATAGMLLRAGWEPQAVEHFIVCAVRAAGDTEVIDRRAAVRTTLAAVNGDRRATGIPTLKRLLPGPIVDCITLWLNVTTEERVADTRTATRADSDIPGIDTAEGRTDAANALKLVARFGDDFRYCTGVSKFFVWNPTNWEQDSAHKIEALAKSVGASLWDDITDAGRNGTDRATLLAMTGFAKRSNNANGIRDMASVVRSDSRIQVDHASFDARPMLLNVLSGTIDLETGGLRAHSRPDYITKIAPIVFDAAATCPTWMRFLDEVFNASGELKEYLRLAAGYTLTGLTVERCLFFLLGIASAGKTTAATTLQKLLGSYATSITTDFLMLSHGQQHPTEMCDLAGVRMALAAETEDGKHFAESHVKQLTGGEDKLKGRRMREDFWEFKASHKLWLTGNHRPTVSTTDEAIWDRLRIIPFDRRFENPDRDLARKLELELPGILNWAITGCLEWQRNGLPSPSAVKTAAESYRHEMDVIGQFVEECCHVGEQFQAGATPLFECYARWGGTEKQTAFGRAMADRGYTSARVTSGHNKGRKFWRGIGLATDAVNSSE